MANKPKTTTEKPAPKPEAQVPEPSATTPEYGAVTPTMVNGRYVGEAVPAKRAPSLLERVALAFNNALQIAVVQEVASAVGAAAPNISGLLAELEAHRAEVKRLHAKVIELSDGLTTLSQRLIALETPAQDSVTPAVES